MARVVRFHKTGGPEVLKIEQLDVPPPGKGEVQISVKALGLNRAESMFRRGEYIEQPDFPARIGYEAAGTVAAVGPDGDGFKVGDAVSTIPAFSMNQYGVCGDLVNAPVHAVARHPATLSWEQAASIWMQYLTGIQIANRVGATPIALTRRSSKRQALLDAGAAHVVATDEQDLVKEILGLTGGKGARVVFDPVGGPTMEKLVGATMPHGIIFIYGALSPEPMTVPALELLAKSIDLRGYWLAEITFPTSDPTRLARGKRFVNEGLADGSLTPIVAKTFPLEEIVEAHRYLESNQQIGKVVVTV